MVVSRIALAAALVAPVLAAAPARAASCPAHAPSLGRVAFVRAHELVVLDLAGCRERVVARGVRGPVAWSGDGLWIAAGGAVVAARTGRPARPFGRLRPGESVGAWGPFGHVLARITRGGGLLLGEPGTQPRRLLPERWGVSGVLFARDGSIAVSRDLRSRRGGEPLREEIWLLRRPSLRPRLVYRAPRGADTPPQLAAVSPDGRAVAFWPFVDHAGSANLDGLPLELATPGRAPRRITRATLAIRGYVTWCGGRLVAVAGADRMASLHKSLVVASPPGWRTRTLAAAGTRSWISPACSPDGRAVAAAAGPDREDAPFGHEARSIWVLSLDGRRRVRLTPTPPRRLSDESPEWSADRRFVLFVRGGPTDRNAAAPGRLYLVATGTHRLYGPLARLETGGNYYGEYGWDWDWHRG